MKEKEEGLYRYRFDFSEYDLEYLREAVASSGDEYAKGLLSRPKVIKYSAKRANTVVEVATGTRMKRAQQKVKDAINRLRLAKKTVTPYAVAKISGVSYNTARKYLNMFNDMK